MDSCVVNFEEAISLESLTDEEKDLLEKNSVTVDYTKGETISKQGSFASNIIYVESGLVKVYIEGKPKNLILTITPEDHFVGLQAIIEGNNTFLYSVSTYVDSRVKLIDIQVFKQLLRQNPVFATKIINILNENSAQAYGRFFCLTRKQLHGRLADILLCFSERIFKSDAFQLPLSRNDLGDLTGMSTESVIRIMKEFKDDKLIKVVCKTIEIIDKERIKKISEVG